MIVITAVEAGQQHVTLVDRRIVFSVAIHIGVDDDIGRVRHDNLVIEYCDSQRREQRRLLDEHGVLVGFPVSIRIFENDHAVTLRILARVTPIIQRFGDPHSTLRIHVDVRRLPEEWRLRPERDLKIIRNGQHARWDEGSGRINSRRWSGRRRGRRGSGGSLGLDRESRSHHCGSQRQTQSPTGARRGNHCWETKPANRPWQWREANARLRARPSPAARVTERRGRPRSHRINRPKPDRSRSCR